MDYDLPKSKNPPTIETVIIEVPSDEKQEDEENEPAPTAGFESHANESLKPHQPPRQIPLNKNRLTMNRLTMPLINFIIKNIKH